MSADSNYDINFQVQIGAEWALPSARIRQAAAWVLEAHTVSLDVGMSIVITGDDEIQQLNRQFRGVDSPTDVLSFPDEPVPGGAEPYLGDLVLSLPYIQRQAAAEGHTLSDELILGVVHGTLHLLGYDHDTPDNQNRMWAKQAEALLELGVNISVPQFEFPDEDESDQGVT